jgi:hypothetical protein
MRLRKPKKTRQSRFQDIADARQATKDKITGTGLYRFKNNSKGTLMLPKPAQDGRRQIGEGEEFIGDSYFITFMKKELIIIEQITIKAPEPLVEERINMSERLILDQPDTIKVDGKIEHVVRGQQPAQQPLPLIEDDADPTKKKVLINEDPLDGIEIVLG